MSAPASELALSFACPQCQETCWVRWEKLAGPIACRACQGRFHLGRGGRLEAASQIELLHFACPRCQEPGRLPAAALAAGRGARCKGCGIELLPGPDHQLHAPEELKEVRRRERQEHEGHRGPASRPWHALPHAWAVAGVAGIVGIAILWWLAGAAQPSGPLALARVLTAQGLADEWEAAEQAAIEERRPAFRRWCILQFASLRDHFRPRGDRASIEVDPLEERDDYCLVRVRIASAYLGERRHLQCWNREDGRWSLDPDASLRAESRFASSGIR